MSSEIEDISIARAVGNAEKLLALLDGLSETDKMSALMIATGEFIVKYSEPSRTKNLLTFWRGLRGYVEKAVS